MKKLSKKMKERIWKAVQSKVLWLALFSIIFYICKQLMKIDLDSTSDVVENIATLIIVILGIFHNPNDDENF